MWRPLPIPSLDKNKEHDKFKQQLDNLIIKNQDWFFPIISAVALWWISINWEYLKNTTCFSDKLFILISIFSYGASLLLILTNLFVSIYFAVKMKEGQKIKFKKLIDSFIQNAFIFAFVFTILWMVLTFISFI